MRKIYRELRSRWRFFITVNWIKTIYFNFKKFPFETAKKLPVFFYGKVKLTNISGNFIIDAPIKRAMIGFAQPYEFITRSKGTAELFCAGTMRFKGTVQFGRDFFVHISSNGYCEFGGKNSLGNSGKLICAEKIVLGHLARIGFESQLIDTNFHQLRDTITGELFKMTAPIILGDNNFISNRVTIMQKTITPNNCTIASNSLCNKDYTTFKENILIGGIPAKLLRENIARDWAGEKELLEGL